jgi:peptide methionine sulfoxide reductase msrA/msrB
MDTIHHINKNRDPMNLSLRSYRTIFNALFIISTLSINIYAQENPDEVWARRKKVMLAGGRLECMQAAFDSIPGILKTTVGYRDREIGRPQLAVIPDIQCGELNPPLKKAKQTELLQEAIVIEYDPKKISFSRILDRFWRSIDPTDAEGQFTDRGPLYQTTIFYCNDEERKIAEESRRLVEKSFAKPIATLIEPAQYAYLIHCIFTDINGTDAFKYFSNFFPLPTKNQHYHRNQPEAYARYCENSERTTALEKLWHSKRKPYPLYSPQELKARLTQEQYSVTQKKELEQPYANDYWKKVERGIYVDIVTGEPLFSSRDKLESKNGWPQFSQPVEDPFTPYGTPCSSAYNVVIEGQFEPRKNGSQRIEIRSRYGNSHLGYFHYVLPFGNKSWYTVNSAALRFIAEKDLDKEGYGDYHELLNQIKATIER